MKSELASNAIFHAAELLLDSGHTQDRQEWQSMRDARPQTRVYEVYDVIFRTIVPVEKDQWATEVSPNLPWAEDHFQERVGGVPLNPGEQYKNWPWYEQGVEEHKPGGTFSHTYMERFWPAYATMGAYENDATMNRGIRFPYGDLGDLVRLLLHRPFTRQAYLPIWFPEDLTAATMEERVPCTLGYHFMASGPKDIDLPPGLRMTYFIRSCDYFRYLRDDLYMAGRLLQWVAERVGMVPISVTMHIANLHIFQPEIERLEREVMREREERFNRAF